MFYDFQLFVVPAFEKNEVNWQGQNEKKVLVACSSAEKAQIDFLTTILNAAKLDFDKDVKFLANAHFGFSKLRQLEDFEYALFFGFSPKEAGLHFDGEKYQIIHFQNCRFHFADDLSSIAADKKLKLALWKNLQLLFLSEKV